MEFSPNLVCALMLWRSGWGLGIFCQFLTELSARDTIMAGYFHFTFLLNKNALLYAVNFSAVFFFIPCFYRCNPLIAKIRTVFMR